MAKEALHVLEMARFAPVFQPLVEALAWEIQEEERATRAAGLPGAHTHECGACGAVYDWGCSCGLPEPTPVMFDLCGRCEAWHNSGR